MRFDHVDSTAAQGGGFSIRFTSVQEWRDMLTIGLASLSVWGVLQLLRLGAQATQHAMAVHDLKTQVARIRHERLRPAAAAEPEARETKPRIAA